MGDPWVDEENKYLSWEEELCLLLDLDIYLINSLPQDLSLMSFIIIFSKQHQQITTNTSLGLCPVSAWRQSPVQAVSCSRSRRPDEASGLQPPQPRTVRAPPPTSTHQRDCSRYPYLVHIYTAHCYCCIQISTFVEDPFYWSPVYYLQVVILCYHVRTVCPALHCLQL